MTVKDTNPITFYCAQNQNDHCQASMVGAINPSDDVCVSTHFSVSLLIALLTLLW